MGRSRDEERRPDGHGERTAARAGHGSIRWSRRGTFPATPGPFEMARRRRQAPIDLTRSSPLAVGLALPPPPPLSWGGYDAHPLGSADARAAIGREVGADPARLALTASTSEAYAHLFKLLCDPGDVVLVPRPSYPLFEVLGRLEGVRVRSYPLRYAGEWMLDRGAFDDALDDSVKAVVVVQPNNPTGSFLRAAELAHIAAAGRPIISDEVFAGYDLRGGERGAPPGLCFRLGGLSKSAGLPQAKLAWVRVEGPGADEALARLEHILDAYLSPNGPVMDHADALLEVGRRRRARIRERILRSLAVLEAHRGGAFDVLPVEGGWYALLRLPATRTDEAWALALLERGVATQPGYFYEIDAEAHLVISLLTPPDELERGLRVLRELLGEG